MGLEVASSELEIFSTPGASVSLATLTGLEIVLGIELLNMRYRTRQASASEA